MTKLFAPLALAAALAVPLLPQQAIAATFTPGGDDSLGCIMTISGVIQDGDADRLRKELEAYVGDPNDGNSDFYRRHSSGEGTPPRICLDSPGGALPEAVKMTDVLTRTGGDLGGIFSDIGTAVPPGAICHSACAVFFMAGGVQSASHAGRLPNRILHATAELGFHAPGLDIADGNYNKAAVNTAFRFAVEAIRQISARQRDLRFPDSLLNVMVSTPPEEMFVLSTVGEASQWMIDVAGLPWPARPRLGHLVNACLNAQPALSNNTGYAESFVPGHHETRPPDLQVLYKRPVLASSFMDHYEDGDLSIEIDPAQGFARLTFDGSAEAGDTNLDCKVNFGGDWPIGTPDRTNHRDLYVEFWNGGYLATGRAALLPPWARFADLQATYGEREIPATDQPLWSERQTGQTQCVTFDRNNRRTDQALCQTEEVLSFSEAGDMTTSLVFTWPSGATTRLDRKDGQSLINGNPWTVNYEASDLPETDGWFDCLINSGTKNTFCYENKP